MTGHASLRRNLRRAHGFEPLAIEGELPADLIGTLVRVGPGLFERFGVEVTHPFEADGVVSAVRFDGHGGATGAARVIESDGYREEQQAGRRLYGTDTPWLRQLRNNLRQRSKNTANTSVWLWNQRLYALMEGGKPTELDLDTLATLGERDFDGVVTRAFSAHPRRVASLATTFNFGMRYGKVTSLDLFAFPDAGPARTLGQVELRWPGLVHDFVATETHLVFVVCPVELVLWRAVLGIGGFAKLFQWKPSLGGELLVVPLAEPDRVQRIACEPFWVWHFANGFRRGDQLVLDLCRYADFSTLDAIAKPKQLMAPPVYQRAVIDLARGQLRQETELDGFAEFPRVHPQVGGAEHRHAWIRWSPDGDRQAIARVEIDGGARSVWQPEPELELGEPIVVPRDHHDEASAWVLVLCHDDRRDRSCVAVLDGRDVEAGPIARLWFEQTIPLTFHGAWLEGGLERA